MKIIFFVFIWFLFDFIIKYLSFFQAVSSPTPTEGKGNKPPAFGSGGEGLFVKSSAFGSGAPSSTTSFIPPTSTSVNSIKGINATAHSAHAVHASSDKPVTSVFTSSFSPPMSTFASSTSSTLFPTPFSGQSVSNTSTQNISRSLFGGSMTGSNIIVSHTGDNINIIASNSSSSSSGVDSNKSSNGNGNGNNSNSSSGDNIDGSNIDTEGNSNRNSDSQSDSNTADDYVVLDKKEPEENKWCHLFLFIFDLFLFLKVKFKIY